MLLAVQLGSKYASGVSNLNFEHIHFQLWWLKLVYLSRTLNKHFLIGCGGERRVQKYFEWMSGKDVGPSMEPCVEISFRFLWKHTRTKRSEEFFTPIHCYNINWTYTYSWYSLRSRICEFWLVQTWFFLVPRDERSLTRLENVDWLKQKWGKS